MRATNVVGCFMCLESSMTRRLVKMLPTIGSRSQIVRASRTPGARRLNTPREIHHKSVRKSLADVLQVGDWSHLAVGWNATHATAQVNFTLCASLDAGAGVAGAGGSSLHRSHETLVIGAWLGAPDAEEPEEYGGYYRGELDNIEVKTPPHGHVCS